MAKVVDPYMGDVLISFKGASICQGPYAVLQNVNIDICKGEFVYIAGRTGSGKTSLLKTLYADLFLAQGKVFVGGYFLEKLRRRERPYLRRRVGVIFQDFQLLFDRTVAENLSFVLRAVGWRNAVNRKKRIVEVLMQVGLGSMDTKMPHQLSGGEQQRLAIARALLNEPLILLADEPTGNLDPDVSEEILQLFLDINNTGTAVLMATHHHDFIHRHPHRTLLCEKGIVRDSHEESLPINQHFTLARTTAS